MKEQIGSNIVNKQFLTEKYFDNPDYTDKFSGVFITDREVNIAELAFDMFNYTPAWVNGLMKFRDFIVGRFGLKTSDQIAKAQKPVLAIGEPYPKFKVIDFNDEEIMFGENDQHLNFVTSVALSRLGNRYEVFSLTAVKYNNGFGRLYFTFVRPFHALIVKSMLNRIVCKFK